MNTESVINILKIIWPLIVIQVGLQLYAFIDIVKKKKTRSLNLTAWILIILLGGIVGSVLYLLLGRSEE